jgi:2-oxoglutarate ferredoxin oxidoreductase subunit beta
VSVVQLHDGSSVRLRSTDDAYDPHDRDAAYTHVRACLSRGEVATGLLFIDEAARDLHEMNRTVPTPLAELPFEALCPGSAALDKLMERYR